MYNQQLFGNIAILNENLAKHRLTGVLTFKDLDEKASLKTSYQTVYGNIQMDLNCASCILAYMNNLCSFYDREFPEYQKNIEKDNNKPKSNLKYNKKKNRKQA